MVAEVEGWESPSAVLGTGGLSLDSSGLTCPLQKNTLPKSAGSFLC